MSDAAVATVMLWVRQWQLVDAQAPARVQARLERALDVAFMTDPAQGTGVRVAEASRSGLQFLWTLTLLAVADDGHRFRLAAVCSALPALPEAFARRQAESWIGVWTAGLALTPDSAEEPAGDAPMRDALAAWQAHDAEVGDADALRRRILTAVRSGAAFRISHHEGTTTLRHDGRHFVCQSSGGHTDHHVYADETAFLQSLRRIYSFRVGPDPDRQDGRWPDTAAERAAWRLIWRQLPDGG